MANIPLPPKVNIGQVVKKKDIASLVAYGQHRLAFPDYYNNLVVPNVGVSPPTAIYSSAYEIVYVSFTFSARNGSVINGVLSKDINLSMPFNFTVRNTLPIEINLILINSESIYCAPISGEDLAMGWGFNVIVRAIKYDESLF
jgi:hypothetical protein